MAGNRPGRDYCSKRNDTGVPERRPGTTGKFSRTPVFRDPFEIAFNSVTLDRAMPGRRE